MKATTLEEVYQNFQYEKPLSPADPELWRFYVDRDHNPIEDIKLKIRLGSSATKILYSGHLGSGKSTELNRIEKEMEESFFCERISITDELDRIDIEYLDLMVLIGVRLFQRALKLHEKTETTSAPPLNSQILDRIKYWKSTLTTQTRTTGETAQAEVEAGAKIGFLTSFFAKFSGKLKTEFGTRKEIRKTIEPQLSDLLQDINSIIFEIERLLGQQDPSRRLLVIIDDLDHVDLKKAEELYFQHGSILAQPACRIIYTVPISLFYSQRFILVKDTLGLGFVLPNIKIREKTSSTPREKGYACLREMILKRLDNSLIETDAIDTAIYYCGGVMRDLVSLIQKACADAIIRKGSGITKANVLNAVNDRRNEYSRMITATDKQLLREIDQGELAAGCEERVLDLLHSRSVLEYLNKGRWCAVNPILEDLLQDN